MLKVLLAVGCCAAFVLSDSQLPQSFENVSTSERREEITDSSLDQPTFFIFPILPSSEYAVAVDDSPSESSSFIDYITSPVITAVSIGSTALSAAKWILLNSSIVLAGMVIVVGACVFTPWCSMIIEKPTFFNKHYASPLTYLDNLEYYVSEAVNKYHEIQNGIYTY